MKRSQMMALINKYFTELKADKIVWDIQYPPDSSKLLDFLIDNGMQPPDYVADVPFGSGTVTEVFYSQWEPEDNDNLH